MRQQADDNRQEVSKLYNLMRETLLQREHALKRFISEYLVKEETQCTDKCQQIQGLLAMLSDFSESLEITNEETDIQILQRQLDRKQIIQSVHDNPDLKEVSSLNVAAFGLNMPSDKQPNVPFVSLNQLKKETEQQQASKVIGPNFKGSVTSTQNLFPIVP